MHFDEKSPKRDNRSITKKDLSMKKGLLLSL